MNIFFAISLSICFGAQKNRFFVSPAKHGRHIVIMSLSASASSSMMSHFWFPIDNF